METRLLAHDYTFSYQTGGQPELQHVFFNPEPGSFNLLVGPSGSGKSTLLKSLAGLLPPFGGEVLSGQVLLNGEAITTIAPFERAKRVAFLFQNPSRQFAMRTPIEQLTFALENIQLPANEITKRIEHAFTQLDIHQLAQRDLLTLSGGEKQKVALAATLALGSSYILLDEPFASVDQSSRSHLLTMLKELQTKAGKTIILTDHDLSGYRDLVDQLYQIDSNGQLISLNPEKLVNEAPTAGAFLNHYQATGPLDWQQLSITLGQRQLMKANDFTLAQNQLGLLSGDNGVGKSTFFNALTHQRPYQGLVNWQKKDSRRIAFKRWALTVGLVFQDASDQFVTLTLAEEIAFSKAHTRLPDYWTNQRIQAALTSLNLQPFQNHSLYQLSGGQQKKAQVLTMLIMGQPVLLFDEPLAGLDYDSIQALMRLIKATIQDNHLSGLMISHQRAGLANFVDYELNLKHASLTLNKGATNET